MPPCIIIKVNRGRKVAVVAVALCSQLSLRLLLLLGTTTTATTTTMSKLLFKINLANNMQNVHSLTKSKISVPKTKSLMNPLVLRTEFLHFVNWPVPKNE